MSLLSQPLDEILSSRSKIRLLRVLLASARPLSGRDTARRARIARVPAARSLEDLVQLGILHRQEMPGQHLYSVNREHLLVREGLSTLFGGETAWLAAVYDELRNLLEEDLAVIGAWIFGSAARGEDRPESDLDLLVAVRSDADEARVRELLSEGEPELRRQFGLRLSPVVLSRERLSRMHGEGATLVNDVLRDGRAVLPVDFDELFR